MKVIRLKRRDFLKSSALTGGGLVLGISDLPLAARMAGEMILLPYLRIASDGGIFIGVPSSEMGQGTHTTLAMLLAEELEVEDGC